MTYRKAVKTFANARYPEKGKPIANNTRLYCRMADEGEPCYGELGVHPVDPRSPDFCYAIRFHATDVVTLYADGSIRLNTDGWTTVTTKARINSHLPKGWYVTSQRGEWYVVTNAKRETIDYGYGAHTYPAHRIRFEDGMVIKPRGTVENVRADTRHFKEWMKANVERWNEEARERAQQKREQRMSELLVAFASADKRGRHPYSRTYGSNLQAGHLQRVLLDSAGTQVLRTTAGNVIAVAHPQRDRQWYPTLVEINREAKSKVAGKLVSIAHAAESRILLTTEDEIETELSHFIEPTL